MNSLRALVFALACAGGCASVERAVGTAAGDGWRTDRTWHDGLAEKASYTATRTIYGKERRYTATAYTNQEHVDPRTSCKSEDGRGLAVFKHHWAELVPTDKYDYRFSTMSYAAVEGLEPYKLTAATQEDCGASFKELVRRDGALHWFESVYFPGAGVRSGKLADLRQVQFQDALALTLRDWDFAHPTGTLALRLVPSQKDNRRVPFEPVPHSVRYAGRSTQELPIGRVDAHELELCDAGGAVVARYWFAAEAAAPWLHVLVRYEGPGGVSYRLAAHERSAYWKHD